MKHACPFCPFGNTHPHTHTHTLINPQLRHVQQHLVASLCCYIASIKKLLLYSHFILCVSAQALTLSSCPCVSYLCALELSIAKILVQGGCFFFSCSAIWIIRTLFRERASPGNSQEILTSLKINYHNTRAGAVQP